jgi:radical SAM superfamily enzyme YgiQ (UPF0313 family)
LEGAAARGCKFCSVTLRPLRWYPYEKIEREIIVNVEAGVNRGLLHAEDVLLYGSKNAIPDRDRVLKLHKSCKRFLRNVGWSHASMSAVAADPKLVEEVSEVLIDEDQECWGAEMGIETGSPNLIKKAMPSKALPFKPEDRPEVVKTAAGIMTDSSLVPACTLIMGLPQETEEDVVKSIELIADLKGFKSLIVPLFFVPMGQLRDEDWFTTEQMNDLQRELLIKCLKHDVYWAKIIMRSYFDTWYGPLASSIYRFFVWLVERKAKEEKIDLEMA